MAVSQSEYNAYVLMKFEEQMRLMGIPPRSPMWDRLYRAVQRAMQAADEFKRLADPLRPEKSAV